MTEMVQEIEKRVPVGTIRMWWLGQAGFAFKSDAGAIIYVDPYLSDACQRLHGFTRLSLPPIRAEQIRADWMIFTHEHTDHLDPDSVPVIAANNPGCLFAGPSACRTPLIEAGVSRASLTVVRPNQTRELDNLTVHAVPADHGDLSPGALSLVIDFGPVRVFVPGDTSWRPKLIEPLCALSPEVVVPPINGSFGNMNHLDAARMVAQVAPRMAIPCHYWTFAEHGPADPLGFLNACKSMCPKTKVVLMKPGQGITVKAASRTKSRGRR